MSIVEQVPYRPWCEEVLQDGPVDFSLKSRKPSTEDPTELRRQLFVRTPDSGFSSPSDSEFRKSISSTSPGSHFGSLYSSEPGLRLDEQVHPLALVKRKSPSVKGRHEDEEATTPPLLESSLRFPFGSSPYNLSPHQASAVQLLSSSLYWHNQASLPSSSTELSPGASKPPHFLHSTPNKIQSPSDVLSPVKRKTPSSSSVTPEKRSKALKKTKASRKLNFDEDKTSPVSGTIIRELEEGEEPLVVRKGDIDPAYNVVEITEEAKEELSKIENKIGEYVCRLCKELYDDAFGLAQHRCSRIIHVEYRCPECDKVFNCPANLASHRRWHKPKGVLPAQCNKGTKSDSKKLFSDTSEAPELLPISEYTDLSDNGDMFACTICPKKFKKQSYLRKHTSMHHQESSEDTDESSHHAFSMFSPGSPPQLQPITPLLSPPFSENIFRCRLCSATFFTPAALQLHYSSIHDADDRPSSSSFLSHLPQFSPKSPHGGLLNYSSYPLLSRPSQISAPS